MNVQEKMTRILKLSQFSDIDTVHMALDTVLYNIIYI